MHPADLATTSVADACRRLAGEAATGTLHVGDPTGPGRVVLVDGLLRWAEAPGPRARLPERLIHAGLLDAASVNGGTGAGDDTRAQAAELLEREVVAPEVVRVFLQEQTLDALLALVDGADGRLTFDAGPDRHGDLPGGIAVDTALAEVARRRRAWERTTALVPGADAIPARAAGAPPDPDLPLEPDERALLEQVDGQRTLGALADGLGLGRHEVVRLAAGLVQLDLVSVDPVSVDDTDREPADPWAGVSSEVDEPDLWVAGVGDAPGGDDGAPPGPDTGAPPAQPAAPDPGDAPSPPDPAAPAVGTGGSDGDQRPGAGGRGGRRRPAGEVSEFLRELSRLSTDDDRAAAPTSPGPGGADGGDPSDRAGGAGAGADEAGDAPDPGDDGDGEADDGDGSDGESTGERRRGLFGWGSRDR